MKQTYCIYKIMNQINGKVYIGFTKNFQNRMNGHLYTANKGAGQAIHAAIRVYGWENFSKEELYYSTDKQHVLDMEDVFINLYEAKGTKGYNVTRGGQQGPPKGYVRKPMTEEQLIRLRERARDPEIRRKISEANKGNHHKLGWKASDKTRAKQRKSSRGRLGRKQSDAERLYRSEIMAGNTIAQGHIHTSDWKHTHSEYMKKRDHSYKIGRHASSETKERMRQSHIKLWKDKKSEAV